MNHVAGTELVASPSPDLTAIRVSSLDWKQIGTNLNEQGSAIVEALLSLEECEALTALYSEEEVFRIRVVMGRHGFGRGEYRYFRYPLPPLIQELRRARHDRGPHRAAVAIHHETQK